MSIYSESCHKTSEAGGQHQFEGRRVMAIRLEAAQRLKAAPAGSMHLLNVLGIEGELISLKAGSGVYELTEKADLKTVSKITAKLRCVPTHGRQGLTQIYVWSFTSDMSVALYIPVDKPSTLEVYDR